MVVLNNWFQLKRGMIYIYESILSSFPGDSDNPLSQTSAFYMLNKVFTWKN